MQPDLSPTQANCRDTLDRLRAQINAHLPPIVSHDWHTNAPVTESVVPLDRLPMIGQVVQHYVEAEAAYLAVAGGKQHGGDQPDPTDYAP